MASPMLAALTVCREREDDKGPRTPLAAFFNSPVQGSKAIVSYLLRWEGYARVISDGDKSSKTRVLSSKAY